MLVRHGQASFGADDYDQLSPLGARQCERLGAHWRERGVHFDAVLTGTLKRHRQSLAALQRGWRGEAPATAPPPEVVLPEAIFPDALEWPGLNEYDSEAIVRAIHPGPLRKPASPDEVRQHFRLLRDGLLAWIDGRSRPAGMPTHAEFVGGVVGALDHVRARHVGQRVLLVSSGGPIAHAVAHVLSAPHPTAIELNLRLRNSAVCALNFSRSRLTLDTFNHVPHLEHADRAGWVTYT